VVQLWLPDPRKDDDSTASERGSARAARIGALAHCRKASERRGQAINAGGGNCLARSAGTDLNRQRMEEYGSTHKHTRVQSTPVFVYVAERAFFDQAYCMCAKKGNVVSTLCSNRTHANTSYTLSYTRKQAIHMHVYIYSR